MTPLEFFISVKNSDAKNGLQEVQQKIEGLKSSTNDLYEGPAREMRIRTEIKGIVQDIAMGQSPLTAFLNSMERLSEMGKFAGGMAAMVALLAGIVVAEVTAEKSTLKLLDSFKKAMAGDVHNMTAEQLKETGRAIDDTEEKLKNATWFQRLMNFAGGRDVLGETATLLKSRRAAADDQIASNLGAQIDADTVRIKYETDERLAMEDEINEVKKKYTDLQNDAIAKGQYANATKYGDQMLAEIDRINDKAMKADEQRAQNQRDLDEQFREAKAEEDPDGDRMAGLLAKQAVAQAKFKADGDDPNAHEDQLTKDMIELSRIKREINTEQKRLTEQQGVAAQKEEDKVQAAASATERLAEEVRKAQFDNLTKEEKVVALRVDVARLEKDVLLASGDAQLVAQRDLARDKTQLHNLLAQPLDHSPDAMIALEGRMSSGSFSRVSNDAANRSEKHLETMVGYLKTMASRSGRLDVEAF